MEVPRRRRGCLQFSLRTILVVMTLSALLCGLLFASPGFVGMLTLFFLYTAAPVALTITIVYGRGYLRTFAIGAMFPGGLAVFFSYAVLFSGFGGLYEGELGIRLVLCAYLVGLFVVLGLYGGFAMLVRWLVERWQRPDTETEPEISQPESPFEEEAAPE